MGDGNRKRKSRTRKRKFVLNQHTKEDGEPTFNGVPQTADSASVRNIGNKHCSKNVKLL